MIKSRSELVFLYDIKDANPNGDPLDENKPRMDEETGINIVTDVRLKRTVRDYLMNFKDQEIFVREITDNNGNIQDAKLRAKDFLTGATNLESADFNEQKRIIQSKIVGDCIDIRLFGATIPLDLTIKEKGKSKSVTGSITLTGPVQFRMGRSLHKVEMKHIKGTGAFASKAGATQKTFREEDILPYSLICFYGIINENAAKHTGLTEEDVKLLLDGIWNGTKNLISRSKAGQMPRLLLKVNYNETGYHIGDLDKLITIKDIKKLNQEKIRDISEIELDASELVETLNRNKNEIKSIDIEVDDRVKIDFSSLDNSIKQNIF
ncbi:MAG: type I-B CRISPR-associated protein Cas7/Csh2 [Methanosarcinales archaeon]|uniref:Type I-B CRISPR-associated protein Cas7/Csh2 n=1 Tax=Candidatus Ethanoperedens thermophilum TaxID=2766897 RepID=A0A848DAD0_9EURY|nr:type I-B CRISPR-associated protein Cas7/Csh2 [Candidatus Ethanoperedens thermophilum]